MIPYYCYGGTRESGVNSRRGVPHTRADYMPLYSSLRCGGMSFAGVGWAQVGGDEKNSFMSRGIITDFFSSRGVEKWQGQG